MPSLHKLTKDFEDAYKDLLESIDEETGEVNQDALIQLNECGESFENKVAGYAEIIRRFEFDVKAYKEEEDRLKRKREITANTVLRLKKSLKESMEILGKASIKTLNYNVRIQNSTPSVKIVDINEVPVEFKTIKKVENVDKNAIREAFKAGQVVNGVEIIKDTHVVIN